MQESSCLEDLEVSGKIILKWIIWKWDEKAWTGGIRVKVRTSGRLL